MIGARHLVNMVLVGLAAVLLASCDQRTVTTFPPETAPHGALMDVDVRVTSVAQTAARLELAFIVTNGRNADIAFAIAHDHYLDISVTAGGQHVVGSVDVSTTTGVVIPAHGQGAVASAFAFSPPLPDGTVPWNLTVRIRTSDNAAFTIAVPGPATKP